MKVGIWAVILLGLIGFFSAVYTVQQTQEAIVLRLGKIEMLQNGEPKIEGPGLHFKIPLIEQVKRFDLRLKTLDINSSRIMTAEQKEVLVDAFVKWKIKNLVTYYTSTGGSAQLAEQLLSQKVNDGLRNEFGQQTISQLLSNDRVIGMQVILKNVQIAAQSLGISVVDVRIKRLDLPTEVEQKIYARMRSAREKIAAQLRADGQQQAEIIQAKADAEVVLILSQAESQASKIRASGAEKAGEIYNQAYAQDPQFYTFLKSLESYQTVFASHQNSQDVLVLRPQGQFFQNFLAPHLSPQA